MTPEEEAMGAFLDALVRRNATGPQSDVAMMMIVANHMGHQKWAGSEPMQDAYLNWFLGGIEHLLKTVGIRKTARANPQSLTTARPPH